MFALVLSEHFRLFCPVTDCSCLLWADRLASASSKIANEAPSARDSMPCTIPGDNVAPFSPVRPKSAHYIVRHDGKTAPSIIHTSQKRIYLVKQGLRL